MSYDPTTDFVALLRLASDTVETERMPGMDYVLVAMSRAGLFSLATGQTEPTVNQSTTVWLKTALPSWTAEGTVYLWNAGTGAYELATADLWSQLSARATALVFQSVVVGAVNLNNDTTLAAVQRANPALTVLTLPRLSTRRNQPLHVVDWSDPVVAHTIRLTPLEAGVTIMRRPEFNLASTADQLAGVTLYPSNDLNAWIITP